MRIVRSGVVSILILFAAVAACTRVDVRRMPPPALRAPSSAAAIEPRPDPSVAMSRLLQTINARRESRSLPELRVDRGLALVAQAAGREYQRLGRGFEQRVAARANADLRSFSLVFARVAAVVVFVEHLDEAEAVLTPAMDPEMRFVGMSVANSPPPTSAQGGYAVVLTLGH